MLDINMSDVISLIQQNQNYLIVLGIILATADVAIALALVFFELKIVRKGYAKRKKTVDAQVETK